MTKDQAVVFFGSLAEIARAAGVSRQAVDQWPERIPEGKQYRLALASGARITGGHLSVDPDLIPDDNTVSDREAQSYA